MDISDLVASQRVIETEANLLQEDTLERLVKAVSVAFAGWSTAKAIHAHLVELFNEELLSSASLIHTLALEFAALSSPDRKELATQLNRLVGPLGTIKESTRNMRVGGVNLISREFRRLTAQGLVDTDIQKALIGTKQLKYQDGLVSTIARSAGVNSRTASKMGLELGKERQRQADPEVIGYIWDSVLDSRTSTICMQLNNTKYYYARSGYKPFPPAHPNCRATTRPLYKDTSRNKKIETLASWAANSPSELKAALGPSKYKLFTEGKLKIERFNDVAIQPLTLKQLKARNKAAAERADLL